MKKTLVAAFILLSVLAHAQSNSSGAADGVPPPLETDLQKHELKGKVKSVIETKYNAVMKFGEAEKADAISTITYLYNTNGMMTEVTEELIKEKMKQVIKYTYNKGNLLTSQSVWKDGKKSRAECIYSDKGHLIEYNVYGDKDELVQKMKFERSSQGLSMEENTYFGDGRLKEREKMTYSGSNLTEKKVYDSDAAHTRTYLYTYDSADNCIKVVEKHPGKRLKDDIYWTTVYKFNEEKQVISEEDTNAKGDEIQTIYEFDENGFERLKFMGFRDGHRSEYTVDAKKNWIRQYSEVLEQGNASRVIKERTIKYY